MRPALESTLPEWFNLADHFPATAQEQKTITKLSIPSRHCEDDTCSSWESMLTTSESQRSLATDSGLITYSQLSTTSSTECLTNLSNHLEALVQNSELPGMRDFSRTM